MHYIPVFCFFSMYLFSNVYSTEISVSSYIVDNSLGVDIHLPILTCHARNTGYKKVTWFKDYVLLREGPADLNNHILPLATLLGGNSSEVSFEHPLKLQGYYWCETDRVSPSSIHDYLFRIKEVNTYVGRMVATRDSLGHYAELSLSEKLGMKKKIYEDEMQSIFFGFLPAPSVYVMNIKELQTGLEVYFLLYVRDVLHPRQPIDNELIKDQHQLDYVVDYLLNQTSTVDPELYYRIMDWADFRGVEMRSLYFKSTLGCFEEMSVMLTQPPTEVTWPYARIGDVVIPDNACSSKNGLSVTRMCTGSFYRGAIWGNPSGKCEKPADGITLQLKELYEDFGRLERTQYIESLKDLTQNPTQLKLTDLHIVTEIMKALSKLPKLKKEEIIGIFAVIDKIIESNATEMIAAKNIIRFTTRILRVFDNILQQASEEEKQISISQKHFLIDTKYTKIANEENRVLGLAVAAPNKEHSLENGSIEFILSNAKLPKYDSIAYFVLPPELVQNRELALESPCQINMVFFKEWDLFQNPKGVLVKRNYVVIPTPVMYVSISGGPAWNLTNPVQLYFKKMIEEKIEDPVCVYYDTRMDDGAGGWSTEGCEFWGLVNGYYNCRCKHLSIFAITLSQRPDIPAKLKLGTSVYVGCGVSILSLSLAVLLFILSKNWRLTADHCILFCLALTYLICIILIFISEIHSLRKSGCMLLALAFHYTVFATFGWLLVHAIVYKLRFAKKTDVSEIPHFMIKAVLSVWGSPIIIVVIMWLSKEYSLPAKENCWLTISEVTMASVIPIVVLMLITLCVNLCATYSLTCRFKKDFLIGDSNYNETAVKFRVSFTIFLFFVMSWLFGFFALFKRTKELTILFSIAITLTAYYVTLFYIFQEISFWDLCCKWKKDKDIPTPAVQYQNKAYKSIEEDSQTEK